jgi:hypothetical protein
MTTMVVVVAVSCSWRQRLGGRRDRIVGTVNWLTDWLTDYWLACGVVTIARRRCSSRKRDTKHRFRGIQCSSRSN